MGKVAVPPFRSSNANLIEVWKTLTLSGASGAATKQAIIFRVVGLVCVWELHGDVTTVLNANNASARFRTNDQTAQIYLSAAGPAMNSAPVGSFICKKGLAAVATSFTSSATAFVIEPAVAESPVHAPFIVGQKMNAGAGVQTDIEYEWINNGSVASGVIRFACEWEALTPGSYVIPV